MENIVYCQSCGMPLTKEEQKGTELNGMKNREHCYFCYENGSYKNPDMNFDDMKDIVTNRMHALKRPDYTIKKAVNLLPILKRWNGK